MQITRGKIPSAKKTVIYGPEGIGKSTFASQFPDSLFIDTEGSTKDIDVARLPAPTSWSMLMEEVKYTISHPEVCKTLVIDTADWAEQLCAAEICSQYQKSGIEDFGYGKGYVFLQEEFGRLLNLLTELTEQRGIHVVLTAHAKMRKFEQPDELGAYDRWEMKLSKQVAPMVKEWADMVLFANYKTHVVKVDGKNKAQGGKRVLYTSHHSCWDAKNRYGLPDEIPFEYHSISHILGEIQRAGTPELKLPPQQDVRPADQGAKEPEKETETAVSNPSSVDTSDGRNRMDQQEEIENKQSLEIDPKIPKALRDLMELHQVDEWDIQNVVAARGYFPSDMPIRDYPEDFVAGVLVGAWEQVHAMIKEARKNMEIPFTI